MEYAKSFYIDIKMYIVPAIFLITGYVIQNSIHDLVWVYRGAYFIGLFSLLIFVLQAQSIEVSKEEIRLIYFWGKQVTIERKEIINYKRKTTFHKIEEVDWVFNLKSEKTMRITNSMRDDASRMKEAVNDFCIGLELIK